MKDLEKVIRIEAISDKPDQSKVGIKVGSDWFNIWKLWEGQNTDAYDQLLYGNHDDLSKKAIQQLSLIRKVVITASLNTQIKSIFPFDGPTPQFATENPVVRQILRLAVF